MMPVQEHKENHKEMQQKNTRRCVCMMPVQKLAVRKLVLVNVGFCSVPKTKTKQIRTKIKTKTIRYKSINTEWDGKWMLTQ